MQENSFSIETASSFPHGAPASPPSQGLHSAGSSPAKRGCPPCCRKAADGHIGECSVGHDRLSEAESAAEAEGLSLAAVKRAKKVLGIGPVKCFLLKEIKKSKKLNSYRHTYLMPKLPARWRARSTARLRLGHGPEC